MTTFPIEFAVLRTQSSRGPYWQLLKATMCRRASSRTTWFEVDPIDFDIRQVEETFQDSSFEIKKAIFQVPSGTHRELQYWVLPITLRYTSDTEVINIPVVAFEYKAWLPMPRQRVPIEDRARVIQITKRFDDQFQGRSSSQFENIPVRPPTPPRSRPSSPESDHSDSSVRSVLTVYPIGPPGGDDTIVWGGEGSLHFPPLPPSPVSRPSSGALPIPELVGTLLIRDAITSDDSCPITAVPFAELESLTATSCFHVFETEAIEAWLSEHSQCPVCRHSVVNKITKQNKN